MRIKQKNTKNFRKERNNNMKRHCRDMKKIMRTKWRSLNFTKSVTRRKVLQPKVLSKLDKPRKLSETIDDPSEEEQKPKKASTDGKKTATKAEKKVKKTLQPKKASTDGKKTATKAEKKVKKTLQPKKASKSPEFVDTDPDDTDDEQKPTVKKSNDYKEPPLLGVKEEVQSFFDLQKESENLAIEKKVEKVVFMRDPIKVMTYHILHYGIPNTSKGC